MLASVGVSVAADPEADPETLLREADVAMYRAKHAGGRARTVRRAACARSSTPTVQIEGALRNALPRTSCCSPTSRCCRWPAARRGRRGARPLAPASAEHGSATRCSPATFLPPAEDSELIVQIGNWVLHTACEQADRWRRNGIAIPVFVNVSARELTELDLAERVREELALLPAARPRPVPGGERGGRHARPRAGARRR